MGVGFDTWKSKVSGTKFVVQNNSSRTLGIFTVRIRPGQQYDLLNIPQVSEADIRHSLLKGALLSKLRSGDLRIIDSTIDLTQFDPEQKAFLESVGVTYGLNSPTTPTTSVATVNLLPALPSTTILAWVDQLRCFFEYDRQSTLIPDGITIIGSDVGGNWIRIVASTSYEYLSQATWTIDPTNGSDLNQGDAAAPLASFDELNRRLSVGAIQQNTTATIVAGATLPSINLSIDAGTFTFSIIGTPTVVYTDTVATYTERVHATPVASQLTATGVADWTPYVGTRLRITSGAATGAIAWIERANPGGAGANVARTSRMAGIPTTIGSSTIFVPAPGSNFVLENLPTATGLSVKLRNTNPTIVSTVLGLKIESISIQGLASSNFAIESAPITFIVVDGCSTDAILSMPNSLSHRRVNLTRCKTGGSVLGASAVIQGGFSLRYGLSTSRLLKIDNKTWQLDSHLVAGTTEGINLSGLSSDQLCSLVLNDVQIFDCSTAGIVYWNPGNLKIVSGLSGNGNVLGVLIGDINNEANCGQFLVWDVASSLPNLLGTTAAIRIIGSPSNIDLTWAQVPFASDEQTGLGTLVNGTATIAARNANLRPPTATHATLAGTAVGTLTIPTATLSASQFVVNSVAAAGALADDDSTFRWHIPAMARKVVICQGNSIA